MSEKALVSNESDAENNGVSVDVTANDRIVQDIVAVNYDIVKEAMDHVDSLNKNPVLGTDEENIARLYVASLDKSNLPPLRNIGDEVKNKCRAHSARNWNYNPI